MRREIAVFVDIIARPISGKLSVKVAPIITIDNLVMLSRSSIDMYYYFIQYKIKQIIYLYFNFEIDYMNN
jgi:hypothetical protein